MTAPALNVGDSAPDATLLDQQGRPVRLSDEWRQAPVVLAFFPAAFSRVCTAEMCSFRDSPAPQLQGVRVVGISTDTFFTLRAWQEALRLQIALLSDFNRTATQAYGVWNEDLYGMIGTSRRAVFLIDRRGRIAYREVLADVREEPDYEALQEAITRLNDREGS